MIPTLVTHILPMTIIYCYFVVGHMMLACIFVVFIWANTNGWAHLCRRIGGVSEDCAVSNDVDSYQPIFWYIMFIVVFQTMLTYGVLIYGRGFGSYIDNVMTEFHSRSTVAYLECVTKGKFLTSLDTLRAVL